MPQFWAINLPQPITPSPAKPSSTNTSARKSIQHSPAYRVPIASTASNSDKVERSTQQISTTRTSNPSTYPYADLTSTKVSNEVVGSMVRPDAETSKHSGTRSRKRNKVNPGAPTTSPRHLIWTANGSKEVVAKQPTTSQLQSPQLDRATGAKDHKRASSDSDEFPDLETLFATKPEPSEPRRIMPNRGAKIIPSVEKSPSNSPPKSCVEVRIPVIPRSKVLRWDEDVLWDVEVPSIETRCRKSNAVLPKESSKKGSGSQISSAAAGEAPSDHAAPTSPRLSEDTGPSGSTTSKSKPNDISKPKKMLNEERRGKKNEFACLMPGDPRVSFAASTSPRRSKGTEATNLIDQSPINGTTTNANDMSAEGMQGRLFELPAVAPNESRSIPETPTPQRYLPPSANRHPYNAISNSNKIPVSGRRGKIGIIPDSGSNGVLGNIATLTPQKRTSTNLATNIASPTAIDSPLPVTPRSRRSTGIVKHEPRSRSPTSGPTSPKPNRAEGASNKGTAPQLYSPGTRRRKLKEDGVVEQPREAYSLEMVENTHRQLRNLEKCLEKLLLDKTKERNRETTATKEHAERKRAKKERRRMRDRGTEEGKTRADMKREKHKRRRHKIQRCKAAERQTRQQSGGDKPTSNNALLSHGDAGGNSTASVGGIQPINGQKTTSGPAPCMAPATSSEANAKAGATTTPKNPQAGQATTADRNISSAQRSQPNPADRQAEGTRSDGATFVNGQVQKRARGRGIPHNKNRERAQVTSSSSTAKDKRGHAARANGRVSKHRPKRSEANTSSRRDGQRVDKHPSSPSPAHKASRPVSQISRGLQSTVNSSSTQIRSTNEPRSNPTVRKDPKHQASRYWGYPGVRREFEVPKNRLQCSCFYLHPYFLQAWLFEPKLATFPGCKTEFLFQAEQVANCRGHSEQVRAFCQRIVAKHSQAGSVSARSFY